MHKTDPRHLTATIWRMAARGAEADTPTDENLVGRFAEGGDSVAFELLVWRHGPMVWATCRRILRHAHDIEDAFQATFLALARNARSIGDRRSVGGWLHRVATNVALKSKERRLITGLPDEIPARGASGTDAGELASVLDEELERLAERPRTAFVLCCLEGLTSEEAARRLGCPVGTVDSRLHAARVRLRDRLTRRGFGPDALGGVLAGLSPPASAWAAAVGTSSGFAASASVDALATQACRVITSKFLSVKSLVWCALAVGLTGSVWVAAGPPRVPPSAPGRRTPAPEPKAVGPRDGLIVLWREGRPISVNTKTKEVKALDGFEQERGSVRLGPDRKSLLIHLRHKINSTAKDPPKEDELYLERAGSGELKEIEVEGVSLNEAFWGANGRTVYGCAMRPRKGAKGFDVTKDFVGWSYDVRTRKVKLLDLPGNVQMMDRSPDGKTFVVVRYEKPAGTPGTYRLGLLPAAGGKFVPLTKAGEATPADFRFSPDGKSVLGRVYRDDGAKYVGDLVVFDLETRRRTPVAVPKGARVHGACWSPDGERIAIVWEPREAAAGREMDGSNGPGRKEYDWRITLARPDGTDAKEFYRGTDFWYGSIDWR